MCYNFGIYPIYASYATIKDFIDPHLLYSSGMYYCSVYIFTTSSPLSFAENHSTTQKVHSTYNQKEMYK